MTRFAVQSCSACVEVASLLCIRHVLVHAPCWNFCLPVCPWIALCCHAPPHDWYCWWVMFRQRPPSSTSSLATSTCNSMLQTRKVSAHDPREVRPQKALLVGSSRRKLRWSLTSTADVLLQQLITMTRVVSTMMWRNKRLGKAETSGPRDKFRMRLEIGGRWASGPDPRRNSLASD